MTAAGEVTVERWLYKDRSDPEARTIAPMELRTGIVAGFWTPEAAKQGLWVVSQMTPKKAAENFARTGTMRPSKSSLDRLPKAVSEQWEAERDDLEMKLREKLSIPANAVTLAISIDGVLAAMEGTEPTAKRAKAAAEGRIIKGPVGYREIGCAALSFCDAKGDLIAAVRMARAPEEGKATLKAQVIADVLAISSVDPSFRSSRSPMAWPTIGRSSTLWFPKGAAFSTSSTRRSTCTRRSPPHMAMAPSRRGTDTRSCASSFARTSTGSPG
jgi:hypothetical protein